MKAIELLRKRGWLLLLCSLVLLLMSPPTAWAQETGEGEETEVEEEDPPAQLVPSRRVTKNGTVIEEGDSPAVQRVRPAWNHDVPPPIAEEDPPEDDDIIVPSSSLQALVPLETVGKQRGADASPSTVQRLRPAWNHDVPPPVAEEDPPEDPEDPSAVSPSLEEPIGIVGRQRGAEASPVPSLLEQDRSAPGDEAWSPGRIGTAEQLSEIREAKMIHYTVGGSSSVVLRSGAYHVLSLVGQPIAGTLASRSGSIWQLHQKLNAVPEMASVNEMLEIPLAFALEANYPNPFNPETTIQFALPEASHVRIEVFDLLGREVVRLVDGEMKAGHHTVVFEAGRLASGLYVYRMVSGSFEQHRTMLLVK